LILAAISQTPTGVSAASITYGVVNYPDLQNGYTVSGTITTNGATGTGLPGTDITSWDISISLGNTTITTINTTNSTNGTGLFTATPTEIGAEFGPLLRVEEILFFTPSPTSSIEWLSNADLTPALYTGTSNNQTLWNSPAPQSATDIIVAVIPEPSSAVLAVIGAVGVVACGLVYRRQAQPRPSDAGHTQPTE
jgi:hypothetical protein